MVNYRALRKFSDNLFVFGCFTLSASIPVSKFTTSVSLFLIALAWFLQWNWKEKKQLFFANKELFFYSDTLILYIFIWIVLFF